MNVELAQQVLDQVLLDPASHNQKAVAIPSTSTACGTVGCLAGWAMLLSKEFELGIHHGKPYSELVRVSDGTDRGSWDYLNEAARVLDIKPTELLNIFYEDNRTTAIKQFEALITKEMAND